MTAPAELITPQLAHSSQQTTGTHCTPLPELKLDTDYTDKPSHHHHHHHRAADSTADSLVTVPLSEDSTHPEAEADSIGDMDNACDQDKASAMVEINRTSAQSLLEDDMSLCSHSRRDSASTLDADCYNSPSMTDDRNVNWTELDKNEEETKSEVADEATALLIARLEQENNALAGNPKSALSTSPRGHLRKSSRPLSIDQIRNLIDDPKKRSSLRSSLHFSQLPTPQMTELEFWAALVSDYTLTASRLPTLTTSKIRGGVPPPLRGVVWPSIAGAQDPDLMAEFIRLSLETSPYEMMIGKDIGRSFPNVEMFRDPQGEGQKMLAKVLKCYSLYDTKIGYCQGLGFVVGPLLMHMSDAEAFCVLVRFIVEVAGNVGVGCGFAPHPYGRALTSLLDRLMNHYDLRSCFLPTLSGLQLRTYQFQSLMARHLPKLHAHLDALGVEPVYVSQWFLSFFGVTCPLPMLLRIYDVLLVEGACETLMRVALSLMQRNEARLIACTEYSDVMQLLLSRSLWDTYAYNADDLVRDFVGLTAMVTRESLAALEEKYTQSQKSGSGSVQFPALQTAATRFLGRLWAGSSASSAASIKSQSGAAVSLSTPGAGATKETDVMKRTPSKQSMASTLNSVETTVSDVSTAPTESWNSGSDASTSTELRMRRRQNTVTSSRNKDRDRDLDAQIEDLLMALTELQRAQAELAHDLQREREEREEDQKIGMQMLTYIKEQPDGPGCAELIKQATERFIASTEQEKKRTSIVQSKGQLQEEVAHWKEKHNVEAARCQDLKRTLDEKEAAMATVREELRETRVRLQESYAEKQRQERTILGLRNTQQDLENRDTRRASIRNSVGATGSGLRELRLGRTDSSLSQGSTIASTSQTPPFSRRVSSLGFPSSLQSSSLSSPSMSSPLPPVIAEPSSATRSATENVGPQPVAGTAGGQATLTKTPSQVSNMDAILVAENEAAVSTQSSQESSKSNGSNHEQDADALLAELVQSKTAEAIARQELEEVKAKLDGLRRLLNYDAADPSSRSIRRERTPSPGESVRSVQSGRSLPARISTASGGSLLTAESNASGRPGKTSRSVTTTAVSPPGGSRFFSGWGKKSTDGK
ncbi:hypothetical protein KEM54_000160 [Ascosphaera aggregata]|nr:hypothetical protein KEM54_000160 [Ascosphaera aggregata]